MTSPRIASLMTWAAQKPHGTRARYVGAKCRCDECRRANRDWARERAKRIVFEGLNPIVSAEPARRHLERLSRLGIGRRAVAEASGVNETLVHQIKTGAKVQCRQRTLERLLAVNRECRSDHSLVDARPTMRAIAALKDAGYTKRWISEELGSRAKTPSIQFHKGKVLAKTAVKVARLVKLIEAGRISR